MTPPLLLLPASVLYEVMTYVPALGVTPGDLAQPRFFNPQVDCFFCRRRYNLCLYHFLPLVSDTRTMNRVAFDSLRTRTKACYDATTRYFDRRRMSSYSYPVVCLGCMQRRCQRQVDARRLAKAATRPGAYFFPEVVACSKGGTLVLKSAYH